MSLFNFISFDDEYMESLIPSDLLIDIYFPKISMFINYSLCGICDLPIIPPGFEKLEKSKKICKWGILIKSEFRPCDKKCTINHIIKLQEYGYLLHIDIYLKDPYLIRSRSTLVEFFIDGILFVDSKDGNSAFINFDDLIMVNVINYY